ncbi:HAMP domain-containing methyl-accepting chemotaxis protein [Pseudogracilibacillus sp. SE30717A]|uniref:methyl-accepting chemotaxis protein n=1 Tax=Pseudogracilibacillus sp. SE30717A TaxID=3098293 RepID=UPI00300DD98C
MKKAFNFKSIRTKILVGFSLIILLVAGLSIYNLISSFQMNEKTEDIIERQIDLLILDEQLTAKMFEATSQIRGYFLYNDSSFKQEFDQSMERMGDIENEIIGRVYLEEDKERIKAIGEKRTEWIEGVEQAVTLFEKGDTEKALTMLTQLKQHAQEIQGDINSIVEIREEKIVSDGHAIINIGEVNAIIFIVVSLLVLIIGVAVALKTAQSISNPIKLVMNRMNELAKGNMSEKPLVTKSRDEIAQLIVATNKMTENNRELINEISQVSESVSGQSEELTQSASEVREGTEQIAKTMEELATGAETQANSATDLASVMGTFNQQVEKANDNGKQIEENSKQILEMTAKGSNLMDSSTKQMEIINHIVKETTEKMEILDKQSQEISTLVQVIRDVAEQTNLLALNAAIEAARAGEQGKGFAVVADEVRKLAEQTASSVNDITNIATNIQEESSDVVKSLDEGYKEVEQGTEQIVMTSQTFQEISSAVTNMAVNINNVSESLSNISTGSQEMNGSVEDIAAVSEESAAGVEETAASTQQVSGSMDEIAGSSFQLAELAEILNGLVGRFRV